MKTAPSTISRTQPTQYGDRVVFQDGGGGQVLDKGYAEFLGKPGQDVIDHFERKGYKVDHIERLIPVIDDRPEPQPQTNPNARMQIDYQYLGPVLYYGAGLLETYEGTIKVVHSSMFPVEHESIGIEIYSDDHEVIQNQLNAFYCGISAKGVVKEP